MEKHESKNRKRNREEKRNGGRVRGKKMCVEGHVCDFFKTYLSICCSPGSTVYLTT